MLLSKMALIVGLFSLISCGVRDPDDAKNEKCSNQPGADLEGKSFRLLESQSHEEKVEAARGVLREIEEVDESFRLKYQLDKRSHSYPNTN